MAIRDLHAAEPGVELPVVSKQEVHDFMPDLEGFGIDAAGEAFVVTDNVGVDDPSGETFFRSPGQM